MLLLHKARLLLAVQAAGTGAGHRIELDLAAVDAVVGGRATVVIVVVVDHWARLVGRVEHLLL